MEASKSTDNEPGLFAFGLQISNIESSTIAAVGGVHGVTQLTTASQPRSDVPKSDVNSKVIQPSGLVDVIENAPNAPPSNPAPAPALEFAFQYSK